MKYVAGKLIHSRIKEKVFSVIEKGALQEINAILLHQTHTSTAKKTFESYGRGGNGAHLLIDKDGTIYQTARLNQKTYHVGKIRSKCNENKTCTKEELTKVKAILFKKGESYRVRVKKLHAHEKAKDYPDRYPLNEDSIGIEIVGAFSKKKGGYESVSTKQNESLSWLLDELYTVLELDKSDVYRHPEVSYKKPSEAKTAKF